MKRAIEEDFPIVEINRLAVPERSSFKPIYQMHKWFARRASCVFRAILLGSLKPAGTNIMEEFYKNHSSDPDTNGKVVLDPFMGGGTTVVEALRLGCKVVGIDLNPVAWFIVKTEVEPVDLKQLDAAFDRLANRIVPWSGKPLRDTLLDLYKTAPPWVDEAESVKGQVSRKGAQGLLPPLVTRPSTLPDSDTIYTFWVKSAICTSSTCRKQVQLFSDYVVAAKSPSVAYYADCACPKCRKTFDWEIEPATLVADPRLMVHRTTYSGGVGRSAMRWTYAHPDGGLYVCQGDGSNGQAAVKWGQLPKGSVCCPQCHEVVKPLQSGGKKKRKKVPLTVLLCPRTEEVFQWRGDLEPGTRVKSPAGHEFDPFAGNMSAKGEFLCPHCGRTDKVIESIRSLPEDQLLPTAAYAMQVYAPCCDPTNDPAKRENRHKDLFDDVNPVSNSDEEESEESLPADTAYAGPYVSPAQNLVWKQKGKYYVRHAPADSTHYQHIDALWNKNKNTLPYPKSAVPVGEKTKSGLIAHHYCYWHQMFNPRQLLALSTLMEAIAVENDMKRRDLLLCALSNTLEANNTFTRNIPSRKTPGGTAPAGVFARHDYQPKMTFCEQNVWGTVSGNNTFISRMQSLRLGLAYAANPYEGDFDDEGKSSKTEGLDPIPTDGQVTLVAGDSREEIVSLPQVDIVITDPPYADNVNYAELADFFYVWLRLLLKRDDPKFAPEYCSKTNEIVENRTRGVTLFDFEAGLTEVFLKSAMRMNNTGLLVFTFHHAEGSSWESVLNSVCNSGLVIEAIYPVHSEREVSLHLQDNEAIAYDLIHVCRKLRPEDTRTKRSWAGLRQLVRQRASEEIARIEAGRYGGQPLPPSDVRMVLIGKCLEVYSRHYGAVLNWDGQPFPLKSALQDIRMMVEQVVSREAPLPGALEGADAFSQVWLLALCDKREVAVDTVSKLTRGVFEVSDLTGHKPPLLRKGRVKGGRTYEVLTPLERLTGLMATLGEATPPSPELDLDLPKSETANGAPLVDILHLLLAHAEQGERLDFLVDRFRGQRESIQAALEYIKQRDPNRWAKVCDRLLPFYSDMLSRGIP
jgi:putative DNA methylase